LNVTQSQLQAERAERERLQAQQSEAQLSQQRRTVNDQIFKAHPDFDTIRASQEFSAYMAQPTRAGASLTLGTLLANEYHSGNADFVIQAINDFKQGRPSLEAIASAPTAGTGTTPASDTNQPQYTADDVAEWNRKRARGEITTEEFKKLRAQYNAQKTAAQAVN
jgi:hypothetical protein